MVKKTEIIFISILVLALISAAIFWFLKLRKSVAENQPNQPTGEEILSTLVASPENGAAAQEEILESLNNPTGSEATAEEILQSLSVPQINN